MLIVFMVSPPVVKFDLETPALPQHRLSDNIIDEKEEKTQRKSHFSSSLLKTLETLNSAPPLKQ